MKTIILADDSASIHLSISNILATAGYAADASGWLVKPATADELLATIKLVIR